MAIKGDRQMQKKDNVYWGRCQCRLTQLTFTTQTSPQSSRQPGLRGFTPRSMWSASCQRRNRFSTWIDWLDRKVSRSHRSTSATNSIRISENFSMFQSCHLGSDGINLPKWNCQLPRPGQLRSVVVAESNRLDCMRSDARRGFSAEDLLCRKRSARRTSLPSVTRRRFSRLWHGVDRI